jgi:hypothetical protein
MTLENRFIYELCIYCVYYSFVLDLSNCSAALKDTFGDIHINGTVYLGLW